MEKKECQNCHQVLSLTYYRKLKGAHNNKIYRSNICRSGKLDKDRLRISSSPEQFINNLIKGLKHNRTKRYFLEDKRFEITTEDLVESYYKQDGKCALSGKTMTYLKDGKGRKDTNISIDRIDPLKPYIKENIQLVCYRTNILKHNLGEEELMEWIELIYYTKGASNGETHRQAEKLC